MTNHPLDVDLLIFDADGTLRECTVPGQPCPNQPGQWRLRPGVQAVLESYPLRCWQQELEQTVALAIVSNQAGVALGYLHPSMPGRLLWETLGASLGMMLRVPDRMLNDPLRSQSGCLDDLGVSVRWCPSHPDVVDMRRKPNPAMLWEALTEHSVLPERALMIGDRPEDELAAQRANVPFMWAAEFFGWEEPHADANRP